jgi:sulfide:quinone oxidoreductase
MTWEDPSSRRFRVVIAGAGVAGLEAALALHDLAGPAVDLVLLAPNSAFVYRPMTVREPFAYESARSYAVDALAHDVGAELVSGSFAWVDTDSRVVHADDDGQLHYDALVLALGARMRPHYAHALTIDDRRMDDIFRGVIQDVEEGYLKRIAFVVPPRMGWPLPIYELALMTAGRAYDMNVEISVTVVTPEDAPLAIFGTGASAGVRQLLQEAGISLVTSTYAEVPEQGRVVLNPGDRRLSVDRVVALPELYGPAVRDLRLGEHGFIPVDMHCKVRGEERVYAAGDATDFPVKQGGIAAQQADAAAEAIAALIGAVPDARPFNPEIHGMLLTGGRPKFLSAHISGGHGFSSQISDEPSWSPPTKIAAKYLGI